MLVLLHQCPGTWPLSESCGSRALSTSNFASNFLCVSECHHHHFLKLLAGLNFLLSFQWWQTKQGLSSPCKQRWELSDGVTVGVLPRPGTAAQTFPSVSSCKDTLINCSCWVSFYTESFYYVLSMYRLIWVMLLDQNHILTQWQQWVLQGGWNLNCQRSYVIELRARWWPEQSSLQEEWVMEERWVY